MAAGVGVGVGAGVGVGWGTGFVGVDAGLDPPQAATRAHTIKPTPATIDLFIWLLRSTSQLSGARKARSTERQE
jgi:hypothetical protein